MDAHYDTLVIMTGTSHTHHYATSTQMGKAISSQLNINLLTHQEAFCLADLAIRLSAGFARIPAVSTEAFRTFESAILP